MTADARLASEPPGFPQINRGYNAVFQPGALSVGLVVPIQRYADSAVPDMADHAARARLADRLGFAALWLRDVPFNVPAFGDAGQVFDPFTYLGFLAASTERIALGVASVVLPLRHPAHVAKAAASADRLSGGRLILGVASGDRPEEYPAMNIPFESRGERFRDAFAYVRKMGDHWPSLDTPLGRLANDMDLLPKPAGTRLPLLVTGSSRQSAEWRARNGDGWMTYPREPVLQARALRDWRHMLAAAGETDKPVMQPLYFDLDPRDDAPPQPLHLGFRSGVRHLRSHLESLRVIGVNHVALNLRFNRADTGTTLEDLAAALGPDFLPDKGQPR